MEHLLAVDLGVKTGMALYNAEGKIIWYRSRNYGNKQRLRTDIQNILDDIPSLVHVFLEGGGAYSSVVFAVNITNSQYIYFSQFIASLFISWICEPCL